MTLHDSSFRRLMARCSHCVPKFLRNRRGARKFAATNVAAEVDTSLKIQPQRRERNSFAHVQNWCDHPLSSADSLLHHPRGASCSSQRHLRWYCGST